VRRTLRIGGREMTDPATVEKARLVLGQHPGRLHGFAVMANHHN
jgi:hypothetical protein